MTLKDAVCHVTMILDINGKTDKFCRQRFLKILSSNFITIFDLLFYKVLKSKDSLKAMLGSILSLQNYYYKIINLTKVLVDPAVAFLREPLEIINLK
jgi:intracellular septation protein A